MVKEYKTITQIAGPLVFVEKTEPVGYKEIVSVNMPDGTTRRGEVLDSSTDIVVVQIFEGTGGLNKECGVVFTGETLKLPASIDLLGRILSGAGDPLDGGPRIVPDQLLDINGAAMNPYARLPPKDFIQTGISTIDGTNTLVRGQKLPIFSASGLPHNEIALQIARQASVPGSETAFAVVFAAMGITNEEAQYFMSDFEKTGALERAVVFLNLADDPAVERLITPRMALTAAEYLAYEHGMHVLVILTDITNYAEALRQMGAARNEVPGRRGYPGYMYTDLATLYERAGIVKGAKGSVTQIPILSMPGDDITHPIPDLSGYITEGQIVVARELHRKGIYPPINVLPSLSRLMNSGIGAGKTREDHKAVSDQMYAGYAEGRDLRGLVAIVGKEALSERDTKFLEFADLFEQQFVTQGRNENRTIADTLDIGWKILAHLPMNQLGRIDNKYIQKYHPAHKKGSVIIMAQDVKPTRSELIQLKKKIKLSESGHKLLKMKRDGLILEFFKILNEARNVRTELDAAYEISRGKINLACAVNGKVAVKSTAFTAKQSPEIQLSGHNIMGVVVPKISSTESANPLYERGYGIIGTNSYIDETAEAYEDLVEKIITAAELETTMKRLLNEIEKTKRRVNALEFKVIPELIATMKYIRFVLEEMERENTFRLKRIKARTK